MERPAVSVIIPIYKVEEYLEACLDSVVGQSLRDIEIICVDDGSPDRCPEICEQYAARDPRVKVIHQENGGLSAARNTGIEHACGEYLAFIDSDDWIYLNYLEVLYRLCVDNDCLIAQCGLQKRWEKDGDTQEFLCPTEIFSGAEMIHRRFEADGWQHVVAWCKLYHASVFSDIRFPVGKIHEDEFTTWRTLWKAPRVACTKSRLYYYRQRSGSIMSGGFNTKSLHVIEAYEERAAFFRSHDSELYQKSLLALFSAVSRIRKNAAAQGLTGDVLPQLDEKYEAVKAELSEEGIPFDDPPPDYPTFPYPVDANSPEVSIIIPVYNAAKFLEGCLDSVLSQTYGKWVAILVDDGSTDASAEICRRYAERDPRFRFISGPNGGVSSARNAGLELAEGKYLAFLDSDDALPPEALERQVSLAEEFHASLVVTNMVKYDFEAPGPSPRIPLTTRWLGASPCFLPAEEFRTKRMRIIRNTSLMESVWSKLYDLSLWKKLGLRFPEDISLGEDFLTNMRFYEACNGVAFLNETGYFYNCCTGSGSLPEKYRPDLFEIKMYLNEEMEKHLGGRQNLTEEERDAFYRYVASSGLKSVEEEIRRNGMDEEVLLARVAQMLEHELFYESVCSVSAVPERFASCRKFVKARRCKALIREMRKGIRRDEEIRAREEAKKQSGNIYYDPGFLNSVSRKVLRAVISRLNDGVCKESLLRLDDDIYRHGIKFAIRRLYKRREE